MRRAHIVLRVCFSCLLLDVLAPRACRGSRPLRNVRAVAWVPTQDGRGRASGLPYRPFSATALPAFIFKPKWTTPARRTAPEVRLRRLSLHGELLAAARNDVRSGTAA